MKIDLKANNVQIRVLVVIAAILVGAMWATLRNRLPHPAVAQLLDLRQDTAIHHFSMVVNVRDAGAHGHAWVTWVRHVSNEDRKVYSFGYFARLRGYDEVFDAEGGLRDELSRHPLPNEVTRFAIVFWLDEDDFYKSLKTIDRWRQSGRYSLFSRDCVTFVSDVLRGLGNELPNRLFAPTPVQYVVAFSERHLWQKALRSK